MYEYRVTKYDPAKRASDGTYLDQQEWTSPGDIGKSANGYTLTPADYLLTEARYVRAILRFFEASGLQHLRVTGLANRDTPEELEDLKRDQPALYEPAFASAQFREDQTVGEAEISLLGKMNLRDILECSMEINGKFFVHFGWDYYMYIGCQAECMSAASGTEADGMYVEPFTSPRRRPDNFTAPAKILVSDKVRDIIAVDGDAIPIVGDEIELPNAKLADLRRWVGMSEEHPFFGYFDIDQAVADRLNAELGLALDLDGCDYTLDTTGQ